MNRSTVKQPVRYFEDLVVYQQARDLANGVYAATRRGEFARDFGLTDQLRRAAVSVLSNIAEGFERGSNTEFIQFLYIAKGSCGEVRAQLGIALDQGYIAKAEHVRLTENCRRISGMLTSLIDYLKGSSIAGMKSKAPTRNQAAEAMDDRVATLRRVQQANIAHQDSPSD